MAPVRRRVIDMGGQVSVTATAVQITLPQSA
jgi:hypothetical protein